MKRFLAASLVALAAVLLAGVPPAGAGGTGPAGKVGVKLTAVPRAVTLASGDAVFTLAADGRSIHYELKVGRITGVTMGHVHEVEGGGGPGAVVAWLYPAGEEAALLREGTFSGTLASGDITAEKLRGPMKGRSVKELFGKLEGGAAGVALHTKGNPGGELWGVAAGKAAKETKAEEGYSAPGY